MSFWTSFWLTNIHFAVELFGAVTFLIVVYVLLGVWLSKKQSRIALRILGFVLLALYCIINSGGSTTDFISNLLLPTKFLAFVFIAISFFIDPVQPPPDKDRQALESFFRRFWEEAFSPVGDYGDEDEAEEDGEEL